MVLKQIRDCVLEVTVSKALNSNKLGAVVVSSFNWESSVLASVVYIFSHWLGNSQDLHVIKIIYHTGIVVGGIIINIEGLEDKWSVLLHYSWLTDTVIECENVSGVDIHQ